MGKVIGLIRGEFNPGQQKRIVGVSEYGVAFLRRAIEYITDFCIISYVVYFIFPDTFMNIQQIMIIKGTFWSGKRLLALIQIDNE